MVWMLIDLLLWLAKAAWGLCVIVGLLLLSQGTDRDRPFAIAWLAGLAALAWAYRGPFLRWLDARRPGAGEPVHVDAPRVVAPASDDMPQVLASLGLPLDSGVSSPAAALTGALAKTTVYRAHRAVTQGRAREAIGSLDALLEQADLDPRVAGVAHYVRAGAYAQLGEQEPMLANIERARALYPGNPVIELAHQNVAATVPGQRFYAPPLARTVEVRRHRLGDTHEAVLRRHPPAEEQPATVKIEYSLAVHATAGGLPVLFVASERNRMHSPDRPGSASHFLGLYPGEGHTNLGGSDDWADLDKFEARALEVARQHLGIL